ncbi:MAG: tetratricopeptide repeat protein [Gemmatimonadota bacterium]
MVRFATRIALIVLLSGAAIVSGCSRSGDGAVPSASKDQLLQLGAASLERGEPAAAIASYRMVLHRDSLNVDALAGLSQAYRAQGRGYPADQYLRRAVYLTYTQGLAALESKDRDAARRAFERTLGLLPQHPLALIRLGDMARQDGLQPAAIEYYRRATGANPDYSEAYIKLGDACAAAGQTEQATAAYETAVQLNLNAFDAYVGLGRIYSLNGNWQMAADQFGKALLIQPQSEAARSGLARARQNL